MIALLRGTVHERRADNVVLLTPGGVGYVLNCSGTTLAALPAAGQETTLLCHLAVREDALTLFGFGSEPERDLFHLLLTVQAVGPKLALAVLSSGGPDEVATSIASGDAKRLQQVPGVGKRTAERIVSELQDKLAGRASVGTGAGGAARGVVTATPVDEAREGLLGLGLSPDEVEALLAVSHGTTAAELIADALRRSRA
ncbi:Holliday junction branch migration protein RuvA [Patulibacter minatonensis]|uniref:Holliday junction branch migration protein RuvA n=1 Tax=Patulibacter minatonensis TaxID=298163 RepID=UPI00047A2743|nr:Holliday junction branch migration protein RuvA [Patulibacter minatonensis]